MRLFSGWYRYAALKVARAISPEFVSSMDLNQGTDTLMEEVRLLSVLPCCNSLQFLFLTWSCTSVGCSSCATHPSCIRPKQLLFHFSDTHLSILSMYPSANPGCTVNDWTLTTSK